MKSNIFIISGPSGAGEDSIMSELRERLEVERIITTTSRQMRLGEVNGKDYYFVSKVDFFEGIKNGNFAEYAQQYNGNYYGVTKDELERVQNSGKIGLWKLEYKGVETVKRIMPEVVAIFINADSLKVLEERIRRRDNVTEDYIKERMEYTKEWLNHLDVYDYRVINKEGKLTEAVDEIFSIIERHRK